MARRKGTFSLAGTMEIQADAPADARLVVDQLTDLTAAESFPYKYVGMIVSCKEDHKAYMLTAADTTVAANWKEIGSDVTVPTKTSDLTNDSGFITNAVNDLVNYYLKSETYTKTEVDSIAAAIKNSRFEVVSELPTTDIKTNVIYLVPKSTAQTNNAKDEYINLDGTTAGWEKIGDTDIDLSGYVTTSALNTALADYTTTADLTTLLAGYVETSDLAAVATSGAYSDLSGTPTIPSATSDLTNDSGFITTSDLATVATTGAYSDLTGTPAPTQYAEMPTAGSDYAGKIVQFVGTTGTYTNGYFYECVEDGGSYSWVQKNVQATQSGGGNITNAITASVDVGGITAGTTYASGTSIESILSALLSPTLYPTLTAPSATLSATGVKLLEKGDTLSTTMTLTFNRGSISPAYGTSGYRAGAATGYALNGGSSQAENTFSVTVTEAQTSYQGTVSYAAGDQPKDSVGGDYDSPLAAGSVNSNTINYEFVNATWSNTAAIGTVAKDSLTSITAKTKTFEFPAQTVANPEIFDVPSAWTITAVEVFNTLNNQWENCASEFTVTDTTHDDAGGTSTNYKRYTDSRGYAAGARKVRIKWS